MRYGENSALKGGILLRFQNDKGLILIDILIVILIAGIIAAIVIPQYSQKKREEKTALSQRNMVALADAQDRFFKQNRYFAGNLMELSSVVPEVRDLVAPDGMAYIFERPDSLSYLIIDPHGYGEVKADTTERKLSWEKKVEPE
jgi:type II secretory pathway pseudopilin PulG